MGGEGLADADRPTRRSIEGFQSAMSYIRQRRRDGQFKFTLDMFLSVHFMITQSDLKANPGNWRPGWVSVRNSQTGEVGHEGADRDLLEPLMNELVAAMKLKPLLDCRARRHGAPESYIVAAVFGWKRSHRASPADSHPGA